MANLLSGLTYGQLLGVGAFGEVFLGEDQAHGRVAVKVLSRKAEWTDQDWSNWKRSFLSEAQHLSRASHDHVVKVHYIAEADDGLSVVICMAYCPGGSLGGSYERGPMLLGTLRDVANDVLLGLQCLHRRDMIHRDIKPANILVTADGSAMIGDFGLVTNDLVVGYASQAGYSDHIAYEVWMGRGTSVRSDIWAMGATLYRLLHSKHWCDESPPPRDLIAHGGFANQLPWLPHIPKRWRRVIRQMMEDDTTKRYQTVEQVLEAVSSLPVSPAWQATVEPERVRWELSKGTRLHIVEWVRKPRNNSWMAWSEAASDHGRRKTLGGSNGVVTGKQSISELENYLS